MHFLSDDFNTTLDTNLWEVVSGSPTVSNSEISIPSGVVLLSKKSFQPPCLVEVVETMTARASTDNFRLGFYTDDRQPGGVELNRHNQFQQGCADVCRWYSQRPDRHRR